MRVERLWLRDFRSWESAELAPAPDGLTVVVGANGEGKTNLLEGLAYLATQASFRGAPPEALVRDGCGVAVVRAEAERGGRSLLLEAELVLSGRGRFQLNRQPVRRARDLLDGLRVSVFTPDDLALVKGGPAERRGWLDATLVALQRRHDATVGDVDRVLRQRNTLLKQAAGKLVGDLITTLDVWDAKFAAAGEALRRAREDAAELLEPEVAKAYADVAGAYPDNGRGGSGVTLRYRASWDGPLADALARARADDVRRGVTTVGPHRDELALRIGGLAARTHGSQGEQRTLSLALRLAAHRLDTDVIGEAPVLLLDDVFSELDTARGEALLAHLPPGQALLTTAGTPPSAARPAMTVHLAGGRIT